MQREKGARFERQLASLLRDQGFHEAERTAQHSGKNGGEPDVRGLPGLHLEAKHQEQMRLYDWVDQAKRDVAEKQSTDIPVVMHKKNNAEILVTMRFEDFCKIYREYINK